METKTVKIQILRIRFFRHTESIFLFVSIEKLGDDICIFWEGNIE